MDKEKQLFWDVRKKQADEFRKLITARVHAAPARTNVSMQRLIERAGPLRAAVYSRGYDGKSDVIERIFAQMNKHYLLIMFNFPVLTSDRTGDIDVALDVIEELTGTTK